MDLERDDDDDDDDDDVVIFSPVCQVRMGDVGGIIHACIGVADA